MPATQQEKSPHLLKFLNRQKIQVDSSEKKWMANKHMERLSQGNENEDVKETYLRWNG